MVRTQIQLTELQSAMLKKLAERRRQSMADLIRQSIDRFLSTEAMAEDDFQKVRQRAILEPDLFDSDLSDLGRNHDKYLAEAYSDGYYIEPDLDIRDEE